MEAAGKTRKQQHLPAWCALKLQATPEHPPRLSHWLMARGGGPMLRLWWGNLYGSAGETTPVRFIATHLGGRISTAATTYSEEFSPIINQTTAAYGEGEGGAALRLFNGPCAVWDAESEDGVLLHSVIETKPETVSAAAFDTSLWAHKPGSRSARHCVINIIFLVNAALSKQGLTILTAQAYSLILINNTINRTQLCDS